MQVSSSQMLKTSLNEICEPDVDPDEFEFVLYVSFQNREQSMGLELCEALDEFCKARGLTTFRLVTRLSAGYTGSKPPRWDEAYIRQELGRLKNI